MLPTGILIYCTISSEAVPFVYLASVCRSLQCLISTLTRVGEGGLLFRFTCSMVLRGGRGTADKCHWPVWGALGLPRSWVCVFPSTLLRLQAALYRAGPTLSAVPVFRYSTKAQTWLALRAVPSPARAAQAARRLTGTLSPGAVRLITPRSLPQIPCALVGCVCLVSVLGSWPLAATLPADVDHPESQEVFG